MKSPLAHPVALLSKRSVLLLGTLGFLLLAQPSKAQDLCYYTGNDTVEYGDVNTAYNVFSYDSHLDYHYAQDTVTGLWYLDWLNEDDTDQNYWTPWIDPDATTDYLYYSDEYRGSWVKIDTISDAVWDNLGYGVGWYDCDYAPESIGFIDPTSDGSYLVGGDNWTYSMVDDVNYAYDTVSEQWYVDTGNTTPSDGWEIWAPTDDPN